MPEFAITSFTFVILLAIYFSKWFIHTSYSNN
jgi:hypothetical protein